MHEYANEQFLNDYEVEYEDLRDSAKPTIDKYYDAFWTMIGDDLFSDRLLLTRNLEDLINFIAISADFKITPSPSHRQSYVLYVLALCALYGYDKNDTTMTKGEFYSGYYLPLLLQALVHNMPAFKKLLAAIDRKIYIHLEEKASDIIGFSLAIYNLSPNTIKSDVRQIFFKTIFTEVSPANIADLNAFYFTQLQHIYYEYIKNKTSDLMSINELSPIRNMVRSDTYSRSTIYELGLRNYKIKTMCQTSDTAEVISKNYDSLSNRVIANKMVSFFKDSTGVHIEKGKMEVLHLNTMNLNELESSMPQICKLLRSIHVISDNSSRITTHQMTFIRDHIYSTIHTRLSKILDADESNEISSILTQTIATELTTGEYIDPRTMTVLTVNSRVFLSQFQKFLVLILDSIIFKLT